MCLAPLGGRRSDVSFVNGSVRPVFFSFELADFGQVRIRVVVLVARDTWQTVGARRIQKDNLMVSRLEMTRQRSHRIDVTG
jgi:hypothetical protein